MVRITRGKAPGMADLHRRMEQVMQALLADARPFSSAAPAWVPRVDIYETADGYVVVMEIPGVEREEIEIVVEEHYLRVSGSRPEPAHAGCVRWHQMEISHGPFERIIALTPDVDLEQISATCRDGFLEIKVPRLIAPSRSVPIEGS
ncbi:MAG: Hsp20/alpha crystallin family protein [Acidobacteria bacterium]|nr:Hsp20/alpha crystallin family protein [Acidobacteriota bacterium]